MASKGQNNDLVVLAYKPSLSTRERHLQRSDARSHAARVTHAQRKRAIHDIQRPGQSSRATSSQISRQQSNPGAKKRSNLLVSVQPYASCLQHGNSDPFDAMVLKITPEVSCLLSIWRQEHSSNFCIAAISWLMDSELRRDANIESELHCKSLLLASSAVLATRHKGNLTLSGIAQKRKYDCLKQLEVTSSFRSDISAKVDLAKSLSMIFIALLLFDEVAEAKRHIEPLYQSLSAVAKLDGMEQIAMISRLYYYDMQTALIYLRPPILDVRATIKDWDAFMAVSRMWSSSRLPVPSKVKYPMFTTELEDFFSRLQRHVDIQTKGLPQISETDSGHLISSNIVDAKDLAAALHSHWILSQQQCLITGTGLSRHQWYDESTASLCALAFIACAKYGPQFVDVRHRAWRVMQALRQNLVNSPPFAANHPSFGAHQYLQLWGYYLGASWEIVVGLKCDEGWFIPRLRQKIHESGIRSWDELGRIVDQFLCVPRTYKPGLLWFLGMADAETVSINEHSRHSSLEQAVFD